MLFLILYLSVFLLLALGFIHIQARILEQFEQQGITQTQQNLAFGFAKNALRSQNNQVIDFLINVPFINLALFLVTIFGTPLLVMLLNYDKIAQEVYDGTLRYLLFRVSRFQLYLTKFLGSLVECALITLVALLFALVWASFQLKGLDFGVTLAYGIRFWAIGQVFLSVFVAFAMMFSTFFKKPFTALIVGATVLFLLFILPFWIDYLSPYDVKYLTGLFYNNSLELAETLGVYVLFTILFWLIGWWNFSRKDL